MLDKQLQRTATRRRGDGVSACAMRVALTFVLLSLSLGCSDGPKYSAAPAVDATARQASAPNSNGSNSRLDSTQVPEDLRDLVPLAEKWGIGDDVDRGEFQSKASRSDKEALKAALAGRNKRITQWLDSFSESKPMPDEAAAFMYMQLGLDEMGLWVD
jgi:hypothetical protein